MAGKYSGLDENELTLILNSPAEEADRIEAGRTLIQYYTSNSLYQKLIELSKGNAPQEVKVAAENEINPVVTGLISYYNINAHASSLEVVAKDSKLSQEFRSIAGIAFIDLIVAKYPKNEPQLKAILDDSGFSDVTRIAAGSMLVGRYTSDGNYCEVRNLGKRTDILPAVVALASANFEKSCANAIEKAKETGNYELILTIKLDNAAQFSSVIRDSARNELLATCDNAITARSSGGHQTGFLLLEIAANQEVPYHHRVTAGMKAIKFCEAVEGNTDLNDIALKSQYPEEVRQKAGLKLVSRYQDKGNSTKLRELQNNAGHLASARQAAKDAIPRAQLKYVEQLIERGCHTELFWISFNPFTHPKNVRRAAKKGIETATRNEIDSMVAAGNYRGLGKLSSHWFILSRESRQLALGSIENAQINLVRNLVHKSKEPAIDELLALARNLEFTPKAVRELKNAIDEAGMKLVTISTSYKLDEIATNDVFSLPVRVAAGLKKIWIETQLHYLFLVIASNSRYPEEVRTAAGFKIIKIHVDSHSVSGLIDLTAYENPPKKFGDALLRAIETAALDTISSLDGAKDTVGLQKFMTLKGLPETVLATARAVLAALVSEMATDPQAYKKAVRELGSGRPSAASGGPKTTTKRN